MRRYTGSFRKSVIATESEEVVIPDNIAVGEDNEVAVDRDVECNEQAIDETNIALDKVEEVTEALESIAECFANSVKDGGFNKVNMHAVNTAIESMCADIDLVFKNNYSLESFNNDVTRAGATQLALEGIVETLKEAFKKFIEMIKKAAEWVMNFFKNVFDKAESTKKKAEELQVKLKALSSSADKKENEMPAGDIGKELIYNGAFPTSFNTPLSELVKHFDDCVKVAVSNLSSFKVVKESAFSVVRSGASVNIKFNEIVTNGFAKKAELSDLSIVSDLQRYGLGTVAYSDRLSVKCSDGIIGGVNLIRISNAVDLAGKETLELIDQIKLFVAHDKDCDKIDIKNIPVLTTSNMVEVLFDVIKNCEDIIGFKQVSEGILSFKKELERGLNALSGAIFFNEETRAASANIQKISRYFVNNLDQPIMGLCSHILKVDKALLLYVNKSLSMYH